MKLFATAILCALAAAIVAAGVARADQNDPRLDRLFEMLKGEDSAPRAPGLTAQIWTIWLESGDPVTDSAMQAGVQAMNDGRFRLAESAFDEVVARAPDFAEGWNKRATVRYLLGNLEGSIADCGQVLALEPRHFGALSGLGLIYAILDEPDAAVEWLEKALAVNPHMPQVQAQVSELRKRLRGKRI